MMLKSLILKPHISIVTYVYMVNLYIKCMPINRAITLQACQVTCIRSVTHSFAKILILTHGAMMISYIHYKVMQHAVAWE